MENTNPTSAGKVVLHVGCGSKRADRLPPIFRTPDWREFRVDIDPGVEPDMIATMIDMPLITNDSIDAVWSSHNLEHLYAHEVPLVLREFLRVLKPGGFALVTMPDLQKVAEYVAKGNLEEPIYQSPAGPICAIDVLYGYRPAIAQGNIFMAHKTGFTAASLANKLATSGFQKIQVESKDLALWAIAYKG